jgi:hypothetical protein
MLTATASYRYLAAGNEIFRADATSIGSRASVEYVQGAAARPATLDLRLEEADSLLRRRAAEERTERLRVV